VTAVANQPAAPESPGICPKTAPANPTIHFGTLDKGEISDLRVLRITFPDPWLTSDNQQVKMSAKGVDTIDKLICVAGSAPADTNGYIAGDSFTIAAGGVGTNPTSDFKVETNCYGAIDPCFVVVGFIPSQTTTETAMLSLGDTKNGGVTIALDGIGSSTTLASPSISSKFFPLSRYSYPMHPTLAINEVTAVKKLAEKVGNDFGRQTATIENFYHSTSGSQLSALTQFNTVYNATANSATVGADIATLDFIPGIELAASTNIQTDAGTSSKNSTNSTSGSLRRLRPLPFATGSAASAGPTLSASQAAQAAQNLANGGNFYLHAIYPIFYSNPGPSDIIYLMGVLRARDGVDIPNFAGTNTVTTDPVNHFSTFTEWKLTVNAITPSNGKNSAGSVFIDGAIGYDYTSHTFSDQNGFGNRSQFLLGQLSGGVIATGNISVGFQRNFGPAQTYIDSTTNVTTTQNQFRAWSLSLIYTKKPANN
jgi:hypothetical protein